jgi:ATP dependent DNA ligase domain
MNINEYIESKRQAIKKIPSEIRERWNNRIVKHSWHLMGVEGAVQYLTNYGNGISATKVISLAICAEFEGYPKVALGFWNKAFEIDTGITPPTPRQAKIRKPTISAEISTTVESQTTPEWKNRTFIPELPPHLQPESIVTMQPVDTTFERSYYINSPEYWGQPKRDGSRIVVIATKDKVYYQSRSTNLKGQPSAEINRALLEVASQIGTFVLDGELYYRSVTGSEHRSSPQALTANVAAGAANIPAIPVYAIFKALWFSEKDLTTATESDRIVAGEEIGKYLQSPPVTGVEGWRGDEFFEVVPTARTQEEKLALVAKQELEGREGEVWVQRNCAYVGGKDTRSQIFVRTKHLLELDLIITKLSLTKAEGRPFGALSVAQEIDGKLVAMGSVGTGFSSSDMEVIARLHAANPGKVKITVRSQGLTETGKLWHGRYTGLCEEYL